MKGDRVNRAYETWDGKKCMEQKTGANKMIQKRSRNGEIESSRQEESNKME